jgi:hypothetical protein
MYRLDYDRLGVIYGLFGGFVGAFALGAIGYLIPIPVSGTDNTLVPYFVSATVALHVPLNSAFTIGWILNLAAGVTIGAMFGALASSISVLDLQIYSRGIGIGALAGVIIWVLFFIPVLSIPVPQLFANDIGVLFEYLGAHVIFGVILGGLTAIGMIRNPRARKIAEEIEIDDRLGSAP